MDTNETPLHIQQAEGLEQFATMLRDNPELAQHFEVHLRYQSHHVFFEAKDVLGLFARAAMRSGANVTKEYNGDHAKVVADWGAVRYSLQTEREQVCERRQVGTEVRTVREYTEVEKEVPVYEYDCKPLLASTKDGER